MGHLGPFWPNFNEGKRGQGGQSLSPKPQVGPPEPVFGPKLAKKALGPILTPFSAMASGNPRGHQRLKSTILFSSRGRFSHSSRNPVLKDAGMVHIWYYIPLCTIFDRQSNGNIFRTLFHDYKSRSSKFITNFEGGPLSSSVWQFLVAIRRSFQDPNHLALQELGWQFFQDHSKGHYKRLVIIQSAVKSASTSILLAQLN
ncbi:hypothetical protein O181_021365 [Austropuccinia psidii MF-1]|uniref:Uncharacterized protein n=1 Tax=Austropuccinia psidii MF-1 TaxID=1389203 RepID=A0A9Q3CFM1_9BASI|nr:hypothetical protein [Austropuccinia psidii MF-1]